MMLIHSLFAALAVFSLINPTSAAPAANSTQTNIACNNSPLLCDLSYSDTTHLGAHDSAFLRDVSTSFSLAGNQFFNATVALSAGVRLLQAQVHTLNGQLELCHTSCSLLDAGSLQNFLSAIKFWMDGNPNEVVTLLFVNSDNNSTATFGSAFQASGISSYGYVPPSYALSGGKVALFPSLRTLITANTRLVTFIANADVDPKYPYLLNEFSYIFETPFSVLSPNAFSCALDRPSSLSSASTAIQSGYMPLLNHFADTAEAFGIQVPDVNDILTTNSPVLNTNGSLGTEAARCKTQWGVKPTFVLVDFWNVAGPIAVVDSLNGVTAPVGRTSVVQSVITSATSSSSSAGTRALRGWSGLEMVGMTLVAVAVMNSLSF